MKKYFYFLCVIASLFTIHSCKNDISEDFISQKKVELTQDEVFSISYDRTKDLEEKTLFNMVNAFANSLQDGTTTRSNPTSFKIIKESFINKEGEFKEQAQATRAINNDDITSKICEIEFSNGSSTGRAIVSANANFPAIIAFMPTCSNEKMIKQTGASELLHASKASYLYNTIKAKELADSLRLPTLEKISKELKLPISQISYDKIKDNIAITDADINTRATPIQIGDIKVQIYSSSIRPLVKTNWGQDAPYNGLFSSINDDGMIDWVRTKNGGKNLTSVPAGCVNIAIAQMMTHTHYYRIPQIKFPIPLPKGAIGVNMEFNPNWYHMSKAPKLEDCGEPGFTDVQRLIVDLYRENKTQSKKDDKDGAVTGSEVSEENMIRTMNKYFKYKPKADFDGDWAWAALREENLVLMLTSDHAFIISGILITKMQVSTREMVKKNDIYWHANLGWANECTGYYQLDSNANTYFDIEGVKEWAHKMDYINNISSN